MSEEQTNPEFLTTLMGTMKSISAVEGDTVDPTEWDDAYYITLPDDITMEVADAVHKHDQNFTVASNIASTHMGVPSPGKRCGTPQPQPSVDIVAMCLEILDKYKT